MVTQNEIQRIKVQNDDCSYFEQPGEQERKAIEFMACNLQNPNVFKISSRIRDEEDEPIVSFDYKRGKWLTGRYIGSAQFRNGDQKYELTIKPRFGKDVLYHMLAEIFDIRNIRFSPDTRSLRHRNDELYYLKILVSYLWLNMLAKANRHGLPRINIKQRQQSPSLKGRLLVSPSLVPLYTTDRLVSEARFKQYDQTIIRLLYKAYTILKKDYGLGSLNISAIAQEAIQHIETNICDMGIIIEKDYRNIRYHPMYANYRAIVDFSWQIIKGKYQINQESQQDHEMMGFFLDMAEIWECYVQKMLVKHLAKHGWRLHENEFMVYPLLFFQRRLIPDIVLQRDNCFMVFDAKWKRMTYRKTDVDRTDFFQIHTYVSHLQTMGQVIMAGLIYPVEGTLGVLTANNYSTSLFNIPLAPTAFIAGGPAFEKENIDFGPLLERIEPVAWKKPDKHGQ